MLRPWPTPVTPSLVLVSLLLACSTAGIDQLSDSQSSGSGGDTSGNSNSAPNTDPTALTSEPPTSTDDTATSEATNPSSGTSVGPDGTTGAISSDTGNTSGPPDTTSTGGSDTTSTTSDTSSGSTGMPPEGCLDKLLNGDETDVDCGGSCPACADDLACLQDTDCASGSCNGEVCVPATCDDEKPDGAETDVDCGGPDCPVCVEGELCLINKDCESGVCSDKVCAAAACDDKVKNADETDVDCGGSCDPCANDKQCLISDDCESLVCDKNLCVAASCSDGVKNGPETDIDCGGPSCAPCQLNGLIINEVDYDQVGTDVDEYVEIYNNTGADVNLAKINLVLVNGANNTTYLNLPLAPAGVLPQGAYLVVASNTVVLPPGTLKIAFAKASDNVQNGNPDGVALVDLSGPTLLDALSYGGEMTMATVTGLGVTNLVEGTALKANIIDNNMTAGSLSRFPNGNDKNNAATDWILSKSPTPGAANKP